MKLPTKFDTNLRSPISPLGTPQLPSQVVRRPGLLETIFASRPEREMHREREAGALAVERVQIEVAVGVANHQTLNIGSIKMKQINDESERIHNELDKQMTMTNKEAEKTQVDVLNQIGFEAFAAEKSMLDSVKAAEEAGQISPDRALILAEMMRSNTEEMVQSAMEMKANIRDARRVRNLRALSIKE